MDSFKIKRHLLNIAIAGFSVLPYDAIAQTVPDAGVIQRQTEAAQPREFNVERPPVEMESKPTEDAHAPRYTVRNFEIHGATIIDTHELLEQIRNQIGQSLTLAQLQQLGQHLSDYYRNQGWLARVVFPEQDMNTGAIRIQIIESRFGGVELEQTDTRADVDLIQRFVLGQPKIGEPLAIQKLESGILKANDLPGIKTTGILQSGQNPGETQVRLRVDDLPWFNGYLNYGNQGVRSTGSNQYQGDLQINDPIGRGDQLSVHALGSEDLVSVRGQYAWLLGDWGTRFALYGSHLQYELGGSFAKLKAEGEATTLGGVFSQPWIRTSTYNLASTLTLENRHNQSNQLSKLTRQRDINSLTAAFNGDILDHGLQAASTNGSLQFMMGQVNIDLASDLKTDSSTARSGGDFLKLNFNVNRTEYLAEDWQLSLAFSGQWAGKNLDSSQKFSLGGPYGVRAYPINEGMGDRGWLVNFEIRRNLGYGLQGLLFADTGGVEVNHSVWSVKDKALNYYMLSGVGLGMRWTHNNQWQASALVGLPLTNNPASDRFNHNSDGTRATDPTGWLSLTRSF